MMTKRTSYGRGSGAPHPIDLYVGRRIRMRRMLIAMNQQTLAKRLNVTFQQIQKYEIGANRVSASRLVQTAEVLGVEVDYFFDGYTGAKLSEAQELERQLWEEPETLDLVRHYCAIPDPRLRARFLDLAKAAEGAGQ